MFGANKESKEEKTARETNELMNRYGLETLSESDKASIRKIIADLSGLGLMKAGILLGGKAEDTAKLGYLSALVEQNWIIIRQLDQLNKKLDK
ncbi:MAG: hypothetical protein PHC95_05035 [Parabacteroides sp.]|nr:hypothetical protein [Parabacteroides sp.]